MSRRTIRSAGCVLAVLLVLGAAARAAAHEVRPGYLELRELGPARVAILWKVPAQGRLRFGIGLALPARCARTAEPVESWTGDAVVERATLACDGGLDGATIAVTGLSATVIDVLVRVVRTDGAVQVARLTPSRPSFEVVRAPSRLAIATTYVGLGIEHIVFGIDHLLFVLALVLLVGVTRRLLATITAFTLAHSITLALATLGVVHVPVRPVEAVIALSIVVVAAEIARGASGGASRRAEGPSVATRYPWIVAFVFGLLHGLGFAGALAEVGLPAQAIPLALVCFNAGVELGQLAFVVLLVAGSWLAQRAQVSRKRWSAAAPPYAIGAIAAYWTLERIVALWR